MDALSKKYAAISIFVLLLAMFFALLALWKPVLNTLADRRIRRNLQGVNQDLIREGELNLVMIGSGGPIANEDRSSPSLAVFAGKTGFLVDVGPGAWKNISRFRLPAQHIAFVLLTHFHSDHIGDLGEVAMQTWAAGRKLPLRVYGPPGVENVVAGFQAAYALDKRYRVLHHGEETMPEAGGRIEAEAFELKGNALTTVFDQDGLKITAFQVAHHPIEPVCGYRIEYRGRIVVVSGDTSKNNNVARYSKQADLLVHDALSHALASRISKVAADLSMPRLVKILDDIPSYHATPVEAAETAREAGVRMLVLTHITPPVPNWRVRRMFMQGVEKVWAGRIVLGEDGITFKLPVGTNRIEIGD
jgi:ribonuclease Z